MALRWSPDLRCCVEMTQCQVAAWPYLTKRIGPGAFGFSHDACQPPETERLRRPGDDEQWIT
eukprot:m.123937 g.123937  ORF g.123937 m.123937 type:complete len:62 (-) comp11137_c0_seq3:61-246(-)